MKLIYLRNPVLQTLFDGGRYAQPAVVVKVNNRGEVMPTVPEAGKLYRADLKGCVLLLTVGDKIDTSAISCDSRFVIEVQA